VQTFQVRHVAVPACVVQGLLAHDELGQKFIRIGFQIRAPGGCTPGRFQLTVHV
jgi:hypothetical protein